MKRPIRVSPLPGARISVVFPDGVEGVIDMSSSVGRGIFTPLADPRVFASVHIGDRGQIAWSEEMEICPDAAYQLARVWQGKHRAFATDWEDVGRCFSRRDPAGKTSGPGEC